MTQKELLYLEDAVSHEDNIIKICKETVDILKDKKLIKFIKDELKEHENMKCKLMDFLEVKCHE